MPVSFGVAIGGRIGYQAGNKRRPTNFVQLAACFKFLDQRQVIDCLTAIKDRKHRFPDSGMFQNKKIFGMQKSGKLDQYLLVDQYRTEHCFLYFHRMGRELFGGKGLRFRLGSSGAYIKHVAVGRCVQKGISHVREISSPRRVRIGNYSLSSKSSKLSESI